MLAEEEYERLCRAKKAVGRTLGELLVEIPRDEGEFERLSPAFNERKTLQTIMDEISLEAESRGLTPEILEQILGEE